MEKSESSIFSTAVEMKNKKKAAPMFDQNGLIPLAFII